MNIYILNRVKLFAKKIAFERRYFSAVFNQVWNTTENILWLDKYMYIVAMLNVLWHAKINKWMRLAYHNVNAQPIFSGTDLPHT